MDTIIWIYVWKTVLILGIGLFGSMAVWVTIGGARDIKKLFKNLGQDDQR